jgi:hypothetical protein
MGDMYSCDTVVANGQYVQLWHLWQMGDVLNMFMRILDCRMVTEVFLLFVGVRRMKVL